MLDFHKILKKLTIKNEIYADINTQVNSDIKTFTDLVILCQNLADNQLVLYREVLNYEVIPLFEALEEDYIRNPESYSMFKTVNDKRKN
ncbi:hypothetical protein PDN41_09985 [Bacillus cereus]|nr:hypothetical protein [Bacillus cereus]